MSFTYLLTVALHAAVLSVFASLVLLGMRQARHRSVVAIAGLLAVGFLPWLTALRPAEPVTAASPEIQSLEANPLPTWTVVTLPALQNETPLSVEPPVASTKFVFPDPVKSLVIVWTVGTVTGLFLLGVAALRVRHWRKLLTPLNDHEWQILQAVSPEIPTRDRFRLSETAASPCVTGYSRPQIVLPRFLLEPESEVELRWAMRHEIAHWRAGDSRWIILFSLIRSVNWWNPLVHHLVSCWADAREQLCDLHATGASENRANYGEFLVAMAGKVSKQPPLAVAMARRSHAVRLKRRIVSLLGAKADSERPTGKGFVVVSSAASIACAVLVSVVKIGAEEPKNVANINNAAESGSVGKQTGEDMPDPASPPPQPAADRVTRPTENPVPPAAPEERRLEVKISNKLLMTSTRPSIKGGAILTKVELQSYLKSVSQTKGVDLMTAPSVTALYGQSAVIEIIREILGTSEQIAARGPQSPTPFTGIRLESVAELLDDQVNLKFDPEYHFIPSVHRSLEEITNTPPRGTNPDQIKIAKCSIATRLSAGQTVCSDLGEVEPGQFLQVFTTVEPLDATGRVLDGFKNGKLLPDDSNRKRSEPTSGRNNADERALPLDSLPSPKVKGHLRLKAVLVEIPLRNERPPGEGLVIGLTPSDHKVAAMIQKTGGAKVRKLKTVEMSLNKRDTPWPEFPGLSVSAIVSKDFKFITITSYAVGGGVGEFPNVWEKMPAGSVMNFGIRSKDPKIERRLLITIEAAK